MKVDFIGNHVKVGDHVFYSTTGRYPESRVGRVVRFTPKTMFVNVVKGNRSSRWNSEDVPVRNDFVRIDWMDI